MAPASDQPEVYQPAEDSDLLARTACEHVDGDDHALDVGTGSGYVAATVAETTHATVIGTDINPHACREARKRGVETVRANLLDPFGNDVFTVVLCNPPYLPTHPDKEWDDWLEQALSGGSSGRRIIEPLLRDLRRVLVPDGLALMVVSTLTGIDAVRDTARTAGLTTREVATDAYPFEKLVVLRFDPITAGH